MNIFRGINLPFSTEGRKTAVARNEIKSKRKCLLRVRSFLMNPVKIHSVNIEIPRSVQR